ncbi:hypothetical protein SELMODRAFT_417967 [Selaginella moellendorffii]|uniref:Uncharacterized protein n=1 Tax=Selaginella moellendorffii TaxID=88036 RepID=D8S485_SELML|nr:hypothetical protein SELMODRAFT_417967 [Selaginella moellendorffii]
MARTPPPPPPHREHARRMPPPKPSPKRARTTSSPPPKRSPPAPAKRYSHSPPKPTEGHAHQQSHLELYIHHRALRHHRGLPSIMELDIHHRALRPPRNIQQPSQRAWTSTHWPLGLDTSPPTASSAPSSAAAAAAFVASPGVLVAGIVMLLLALVAIVTGVWILLKRRRNKVHGDIHHDDILVEYGHQPSGGNSGSSSNQWEHQEEGGCSRIREVLRPPRRLPPSALPAGARHKSASENDPLFRAADPVHGQQGSRENVTMEDPLVVFPAYEVDEQRRLFSATPEDDPLFSTGGYSHHPAGEKMAANELPVRLSSRRDRVPEQFHGKVADRSGTAFDSGDVATLAKKRAEMEKQMQKFIMMEPCIRPFSHRLVISALELTIWTDEAESIRKRDVENSPEITSDENLVGKVTVNDPKRVKSDLEVEPSAPGHASLDR